jgi:hypothetical protein
MSEVEVGRLLDRIGELQGRLADAVDRVRQCGGNCGIG